MGGTSAINTFMARVDVVEGVCVGVEVAVADADAVPVSVANELPYEE